LRELAATYDDALRKLGHQKQDDDEQQHHRGAVGLAIAAPAASASAALAADGRALAAQVLTTFSLPKTAVISDSVTVFKSRLKTFIPLLSGFLSFSVAHYPTPAPLKLRPYGAIQIRLLLLLLLL